MNRQRCNCTFPVLVTALVVGLLIGIGAAMFANSVSEARFEAEQSVTTAAPQALPTTPAEPTRDPYEGGFEGVVPVELVYDEPRVITTPTPEATDDPVVIELPCSCHQVRPSSNPLRVDVIL